MRRTFTLAADVFPGGGVDAKELNKFTLQPRYGCGNNPNCFSSPGLRRMNLQFPEVSPKDFLSESKTLAMTIDNECIEHSHNMGNLPLNKLNNVLCSSSSNILVVTPQPPPSSSSSSLPRALTKRRRCLEQYPTDSMEILPSHPIPARVSFYSLSLVPSETHERLSLMPNKPHLTAKGAENDLGHRLMSKGMVVATENEHPNSEGS